MHILLYISNYFIPFLILSIIICGLTAKIDVYETFITGAKNGCRTVIRLVPTLIGLMTATGILRASGFLDVISSSSAASGLLVDLYKTYGTDSRIGLIASLSMSCTETIFYTMSVYFMTARIRHTRYTLPGAVFATSAGLAASVLLAGYYS